MHVLSKKNFGTIALCILPGLIIYTIVTIVPVIEASYLSFFDGVGFSHKTFVGFGNYKEIFSNSEFWHALKNNLLYVIFCVFGQVGIAFLMTLLLTWRKMKLEGLFSGILFIPCILAPVVIGFIGMMLYNSRIGLLNTVLKVMGLGSLAHNWLEDPHIVIYSLIALHIWQWIGYYVVIFVAAFHGISESVLESSSIDGAVGLKKIWYIIMPLMKDSIGVCFMLCIAGTMKVFDTVYVMTGGGPGTASEVLTMYMYNNTFNNFRMNFGSAISIVILLSSLVLIIGSRKLFNRGEEDLI